MNFPFYNISVVSILIARDVHQRKQFILLQGDLLFICLVKLTSDSGKVQQSMFVAVREIFEYKKG